MLPTRHLVVRSTLALLTLFAGLAFQPAMAEPSIEGNIIVFPEDGWYQVQRSDTFASVCNGELTCTVEPGIYNIINHTSGDRFESVRVPVESSGPTQVTVIGNEIVWPDDGWYQVQDANTFESICDGARSCTVADGTYIVINHTTGRRVEPVVVPGSDVPLPEVVSVAGNQIGWLDDGWYQVQDATTLASVCEGGQYCTVAPGTYLVINHTGGVRYEEIEVAAAPLDRMINKDSYLGLFRNVVRILNAESLNADRMIADDLGVDLTWAGFDVRNGEAGNPELTLLSQIENDSTLTTQNYACAEGGALALSLLDFGFAPVTKREFLFDRCAYAATRYSGGYSFERSRRSPVVITLNDFSVATADSSQFDINGRWIDLTGANPFGIESTSWTDTTYIRQSIDSASTISGFDWTRTASESSSPTADVSGYLQLADGSTAYIRLIGQNASLESDFHVSANWSFEQDVRVQASLNFESAYFNWSTFAPGAEVIVPDFPVSQLGTPLTIYPTPNFNPGDAIVVDNNPRRDVQWENGEIRLIAFDGSTAVMQPNPDDSESVIVSIDASPEPILDRWSNGLQIACPNTFSDECGR